MCFLCRIGPLRQQMQAHGNATILFATFHTQTLAIAQCFAGDQQNFAEPIAILQSHSKKNHMRCSLFPLPPHLRQTPYLFKRYIVCEWAVGSDDRVLIVIEQRRRFRHQTTDGQILNQRLGSRCSCHLQGPGIAKLESTHRDRGLHGKGKQRIRSNCRQLQGYRTALVQRCSLTEMTELDQKVVVQNSHPVPCTHGH